MNIHQALKEKNKLAGKLKTLDTRLLASGHWVKGNTPAYNIHELLAERIKVMSDIVALKSRISIATQPIIGSIMKMAEKKAFITTLKSLDVSSGVNSSRYSRHGSEATIYESTMTEREKDELVEREELEISALQDDLDKFNALTEI